MANNTLDPFVEPQDIIGGWKVISDGQKLVFDLQNNVYGQAQQTTKNAVDLATLLLPGPGEAATVGKLGKLGEAAELANAADSLREISIFGFRGAGSPRDLIDGTVHPYTVTGHVGYSFDGGKTIFGFGPDVYGKSNFEIIQSLRKGDSYPGLVTDDTSVFKYVANNPGEARGGLPQVVYEQKIPVTQEQFSEIQKMHDSIGVKNPLDDVRYVFPGRRGLNLVSAILTAPRFQVI